MPADPPSSETPSTTPLGDSPWFWMALFAAAALVALSAIQQHYLGRQGQIERRYEARSRQALERPPASQGPHEAQPAGRPPQMPPQAPAEPAEPSEIPREGLRIPLAPLRWLLLALLVLSITMLFFQRRARHDLAG